MAQLVKAGESVSVVIFLGCCAFAKIDRHANESNVRPLLAQPSPRNLPLHSLSSPTHLWPRGERMIGWRCNSWYAFLPRPTSRQCLFVYSVYTTPGYRRVITVVHHGQLDETACRMPAANCCSRVCWTLMQLWRILILWISDSAFSVSAFGKSVARIRVAKIWDGRKYLYNSKNCRKKK